MLSANSFALPHMVLTKFKLKITSLNSCWLDVSLVLISCVNSSACGTTVTSHGLLRCDNHRIAENFCWCKKNTSKTLQNKVLGTNTWCSDHTPTSWLPHPIYESLATQRNKAKKQFKPVQRLSLCSCGGNHVYEGASNWLVEQLACRTEGIITAGLNFRSSLTVSLASCIVAGW